MAGTSCRVVTAGSTGAAGAVSAARRLPAQVGASCRRNVGVSTHAVPGAHDSARGRLVHLQGLRIMACASSMTLRVPSLGPTVRGNPGSGLTSAVIGRFRCNS